MAGELNLTDGSLYLVDATFSPADASTALNKVLVAKEPLQKQPYLQGEWLDGNDNTVYFNQELKEPCVLA